MAAPRGHEEVAALVTREWVAILGVADSSDDQTFLELGGDSLLAIELIERIESALEIEFPVEVLFVGGTLPEVVRAVAEASAAR